MRRKNVLLTGLLNLALCLFLLSALSAHAQQTYRLVDRSAAGDVAQTEQELSMDITMKIAAGNAPAHAFHDSMQQTEKYSQSILSKDARGKTDKLRRTYTVNREVKNELNKETVNTSALQGKTVVIERKGKEVFVTSPNGTLSKGDRITLQDSLDNEFDLVPNHAVTIGEEWEVDPQKIARSASFKEVKNGSVHVKLLEIVAFGGHRCARMRVKMHVELPISDEVSIKIDVEGDGYLAMDIERMLEMDLRGPALFTGSSFGEGVAIQSSTGTAHLKTVLHWQKVAGKPVTANKAG